MRPEEQRIAIAEWCGQNLFVIHKPIRDPFGYYREKAKGYTDLEHAWRVTEDVAKKYVGGRPTDSDRVIMEPANIPDYLNDLNVMQEAEQRLRENQFQFVAYPRELFKVVSGTDLDKDGLGYFSFNFIHATAAQRAEALLRTIGKWND